MNPTLRPRSSVRPGFALAMVLLSLGSLPAAGADSPPPPAPQMDEVIITGRRPVTPTFQDELDFHDFEYQRLKKIYAPDPPAIPRASTLVRMPEALSSTVQGKPTLTERY